ncbi:MAG: hypothetical protein E6J91_36845 [Deltaproteobacteria bacterium]|nr:MAG: hypothetical protein E6J91_36845 [Deltaproteobacteria bacterium]
MSDPKRGGSRDISELKQRLGLKKATPPAATARNGAPGGVVPPPGLAPPAPPQPVIPNAADDPFAAMNAMAAVGTVQRAPEIVIINDGKPVENVGPSSHGAMIAKIVAPAVIALIVGVVIGQIAKSANLYNAGLKDARSILGDDKAASTVKNVKKALSELDGVLDEMKNKSYRPDTAADKKLRELSGRLDVKTATVFRTAAAIEPELTGLVMSFYAGAAEVKGMVDTHVKAAAADDLALAAGRTAAGNAQVKDTDNAALASVGAVRYGALIQAPTETDRTDFGVKIVELGPPYCGGPNPVTSGKCDNNEPPTAYAYRNEPGAGWIKGDLQVGGSDSVPAKKLVLLLPNGTRDALIKGSEPGASEVFYVKRLRALADRTKKLIEEANKLEQRLQAESNKSTRFSFFL